MTAQPDVCANCGHDIYSLGTMSSGTVIWRHRDLDSTGGCRAASYRRGEGFDDSIPREWKARPLRAGKQPTVTPPPEQVARRRAEVSEVPPLDDRTANLAMVIGIAIRNELEELHGGNVPNSLTDEQMAKINPIVRNAAATVLHAVNHPSNPKLNFWLAFQERAVPDYWERPELVEL